MAFICLLKLCSLFADTYVSEKGIAAPAVKLWAALMVLRADAKACGGAVLFLCATDGDGVHQDFSICDRNIYIFSILSEIGPNFYEDINHWRSRVYRFPSC